MKIKNSVITSHSHVLVRVRRGADVHHLLLSRPSEGFYKQYNKDTPYLQYPEGKKEQVFDGPNNTRPRKNSDGSLYLRPVFTKAEEELIETINHRFMAARIKDILRDDANVEFESVAADDSDAAQAAYLDALYLELRSGFTEEELYTMIEEAGKLNNQIQIEEDIKDFLYDQ